MRLSLAAALLAMSLAAQAQQGPPDAGDAEVQYSAPPDLRLDGLIPLEMPRSTLRFGVDPASVSVGTDRIVRYVVVATSDTGAVNALYEGIRCRTGEFKVYARHTPGAGWTQVKDSPWQSLQGQRHSQLIAREGACVGRGANLTAAQVVHDLRSPVDRRFGN